MHAISPVNITKFIYNEFSAHSDLVVVEEPLEIRLGYGEMDARQQKSVSVTMRTPTHDFDLALGFLYSEGIIKSYNQILSIKYCVDAGKQATENIVRVELKPDVIVNDQFLQRNFYATSSCGVCGKASIEAIDQLICELPQQKLECQSFQINPDILLQLPHSLSQHQKTFEYTGGLHAAALFDFEGNIVLLKEDIGRHNALDKIIGNALTQDLLPLQNKILLMSSRASFELIQKAAMARIPVVATIGAPSSLAVQMAKQFGITLIGFLRGEQFNVYAGSERINVNFVWATPSEFGFVRLMDLQDCTHISVI
jgi:FdhD protein